MSYVLVFLAYFAIRFGIPVWWESVEYNLARQKQRKAFIEKWRYK
jgi:hypothetical protein